MATTTCKIMATGIALAILTACGGGGGGDDGAALLDGPLAKYVGSYQSCDMDNELLIVNISQQSSDILNMSLQTNYFANKNCTGELIATETLSSPFTVSYKSTESALVYGIESGAITTTVDSVLVTLPATTISLTGSGVVGNCINIPNKRTCLNETTIPAGSSNGGLYINGSKFATLEKTGQIYTVDNILTRK